MAIVKEEPINVSAVETLFREIMTRKRNRKIVNSEIIGVEEKVSETEEEAVVNRQTSSNISVTTARDMVISHYKNVWF